MADDFWSDEDDNSCPICLDEFKSPKLLPCRHTFCSSCLDVYISRLKQVSDEISCPFCRNQCELPKGGISGFLTNYFVNDKNFSKNCQDSVESYPDQLPSDLNLLCQDSAASSNEVATEDARSEASDDCEFNTPVSLLCVQRSEKQTSCKMAVDSTIYLPTISDSEGLMSVERDSGNNMVSALCPTPDNECLVVVNCNGEVFEINEYGKCSRQINIGGEGPALLDIAFRSDGNVLLLTTHDVFVALQDQMIYNFAHFEPYYGLSLAAFRDDRVVIVCYNKEVTDSEESEPSETGVMLILSDVGDVMYKVVPGEDFPAFRPYDVAINPISGLIYTSDPTHGSVYIFLECGTFVDKIDGDVLFRIFGMESLSFIPLGITCDSIGNMIVSDRGSENLIHLSPDGDFRGMFILEKFRHEDEPDFPWLVKLGDNGTIWVGYKPSCTVRTFSVIQFINRLD